MISAGVTGGIGSGKTTLCELFEKLGAEVVYADELARRMMETDDSLRAKLKTVFGEETYNSDGTLNRPHLIRQAFRLNRVEELNEIVHPALRVKTIELIKKAKERGAPLFVLEAAVLLNKGRPDHLDKIILVKSRKENRMERVKQRDRVSEEDIIARMDKQPDFDRLHHLADYVIENDGDIAGLEKKAEELFHQLVNYERI